MKSRISAFLAAISESVHQQVNMYAFGRLLAVVGLLALAQPSEAKIVYTKTNVVIHNSTYYLDLNHDGITDFTIGESSIHDNRCKQGPYDRAELDLAPAQGNGVVFSATYGPNWAAALNRGLTIGPNQSFYPASGMAAVVKGYPLWGGCHYFQWLAGDWANVSNRYLGLEFQINGRTHYGWARLSVQVGYVYVNATLTGYAYETIPGKSIIAGKTHGPADDPTNDSDYANPEDPGPGASLTNPISDTRQTASLGMLALDARRPVMAAQGKSRDDENVNDEPGFRIALQEDL